MPPVNDRTTGPEVTRRGVLDIQVCVPETWTFKQVEEYANREVLCGTTIGWKVRKSKKLLAGDPVRNPCSKKAGYVHVTLDA